jgi:hypothetical protein
MSYELSIIVEGRGLDPNNRSHWAFMISRQGDSFGDRLNVVLLDRTNLRYIREVRSAVLMKSPQTEGRCILAVWNSQQRQKGVEVIQKEPAPHDGKRRCQDWTLEVLIGLEAEELIPAGTSATWGELVGKPVADVAAALGQSWEAFSVLA